MKTKPINFRAHVIVKTPQFGALFKNVYCICVPFLSEISEKMMKSEFWEVYKLSDANWEKRDAFCECGSIFKKLGLSFLPTFLYMKTYTTMLIHCIPGLEWPFKQNVRARLKILTQRQVVIVSRTKSHCKQTFLIKLFCRKDSFTGRLQKHEW